MAALTSPVGSAAVLLQQLPKQAVVRMAAAVVSHGGADVFGHFVEIGDQFVDRRSADAGPLERLVQIGHISLVMLVMVDFHRRRIDERLQRIEGVAQGRQRINRLAASFALAAVAKIEVAVAAKAAAPADFKKFRRLIVAKELDERPR